MCPGGALLQGLDSFPGGGLGQPDAVTLVWQRWAWCRSRSTVAVARVLGMISSNPEGWRFELLTATAAPFVGGVDQPVEALGGVRG